MTRLEFLSYVKEALKRTDKDDEIYRALDDTLYDLTTQYPFQVHQSETSITLINDTAEYDLSSLSISIILKNAKYRDATGDAWVLQQYSKEMFDLRWPDLTTTDFINDEPQDYMIYNNKLTIAPFATTVTTETILLPIATIATKLTADGDTPAFEDQWREVIKFGVLGRVYNLFEDQQSRQKSQDSFGLYTRGIENMKSIDEDKNDGPMQVSYLGV